MISKENKRQAVQHLQQADCIMINQILKVDITVNSYYPSRRCETCAEGVRWVCTGIPKRSTHHTSREVNLAGK